MLSDIFEVLPLVIRMERDLLPNVFNKGKLKKIEGLESYSSEFEFYGNFEARLNKRIDVSKSESIILTLLFK